VRRAHADSGKPLRSIMAQHGGRTVRQAFARRALAQQVQHESTRRARRVVDQIALARAACESEFLQDN
jgi:hypothetical protein